MSDQEQQQQEEAKQAEAPQQQAIVQAQTSIETARSSSITLTAGGFMPSNFEEAWRFATALSKSSIIPDKFRNKPADCFIAIEYSANLHVPVLMLMKNLAVINGVPAIWGDVMLAIVQRHPHYERHKEYFEGTGDSRTAVFEIKRRGHDLHIQRFSVADAKTAKLWGKSGPWTNNPDRMLQMRSRGFGCRDKFADALCGLISVEEARDYPAAGEMIEVGAEQVDDCSDLKNEIADLLKNQLKTDASGNRWNDARISHELRLCKSRTELERLKSRCTDELAARSVPEAVPQVRQTEAIEVQPEPPKEAEPRKQEAKPAEEAAKPKVTTHQAEATATSSASGSVRGNQAPAADGCADCKKAGGRCMKHLQERKAMSATFLKLLGEIMEAGGLSKPPDSFISLEKFDALDPAMQKTVIDQAEAHLGMIEAKKNAKKVNQPSGDDLFGRKK